MTMESVLKKLESRIEEFVELYRSASARVAELESKVSELEEQLAAPAKVEDKVKDLEAQRKEMADRLEKVLGVIDAAIDEAE
jgi:DNA repair ATPase RecN